MSASEVRIISSRSPMRAPGRLLASMWRDLTRSWELAYLLMVRDISVQYRQTILGYFWAVFPPVMTSAPFVLLERTEVIEVAPTGLPYPIFVFSGTVFFQLFIDALQAPLRSVEGAKSLLTRIYFPREALVLAGAGTVLFSFLIKAALLGLVLAYYGVAPAASTPVALVAVLGLLALGTLIGTLLVPVGMFYRDVSLALPYVAWAWMFATPVLYPVPSEGTLARVVASNPVTPLLEVARTALLIGMPPDLGPFAAVLAGSGLLLFAGWLVFHIAVPRIAERLGS